MYDLRTRYSEGLSPVKGDSENNGFLGELAPEERGNFPLQCAHSRQNLADEAFGRRSLDMLADVYRSDNIFASVADRYCDRQQSRLQFPVLYAVVLIPDTAH